MPEQASEQIGGRRRGGSPESMHARPVHPAVDRTVGRMR